MNLFKFVTFQLKYDQLCDVINRIALLWQYAPELQVCDKAITVEELENDERLVDFCKILRTARTTVENDCNSSNKNYGKKGKKKQLTKYCYNSIFNNLVFTIHFLE